MSDEMNEDIEPNSYADWREALRVVRGVHAGNVALYFNEDGWPSSVKAVVGPKLVWISADGAFHASVQRIYDRTAASAIEAAHRYATEQRAELEAAQSRGRDGVEAMARVTSVQALQMRVDDLVRRMDAVEAVLAPRKQADEPTSLRDKGIASYEAALVAARSVGVLGADEEAPLHEVVDKLVDRITTMDAARMTERMPMYGGAKPATRSPGPVVEVLPDNVGFIVRVTGADGSEAFMGLTAQAVPFLTRSRYYDDRHRWNNRPAAVSVANPWCAMFGLPPVKL